MADAQEKLILEIDVSSLAKNIAEAKRDLESYRAEAEKAKEVNGELSEQAITHAARVKAQAKEVSQLEGSLVRLTQAEKLHGHSLQSVIKNYDASKNSIDQNRKVLNALNAEYIKTRNPTAEFTNSIKKISDELKKQEGAIGDTRRNVGNYKESILDAVGGLRLMGHSVSTFIDPLRNMKLGFDAAGGGAKGFAAALAATGLPIIIAAVQALSDVLSSLESVADDTEDAMSGLKETWKQLPFILNDAIHGAGNLRKGLSNAYDEGMKLSQAMREIHEQQVIQNADNANAEKQIAILLLKSRDRTKSEQERIAFLDEASEKERKNLEQKLDIAKKEELIAETEFGKAVARGLEKDDLAEKLSQAQIKRLNFEKDSALIQEKIDIRRNDLLQKIEDEQAKRNADALKRKEELDKSLEDLASKNAERERLFIESTTEGTEKRLALFELEFETRRTQMRDAGVSEVDITRNYETEKTAILQGEIDKRNNLENRSAEARAQRNSALEELRITAVKASLEQETKLYELHFERKIADLREAGFTEIEIEEIKQRDLLDIRNKYALRAADAAKKLERDQIQATTAIVGSALNVVSSIGDILTAELDEKQAQLKEALENGRINQDQYAEETKKLKMEQFEQNKAVALSSAILQGINATLAAYASGAAVPIVGTVLGPVFAGLAAAFSAVQIGLIASQAPPKFAEGGDLGKVIPITGRSHAQGGVDVAIGGRTVAEVEDGEGMFIMKRDAYQQIDKLSKWNMLFGGRSWGGAPVTHAAEGGSVGPFARGRAFVNLFEGGGFGDGGFVARETSRMANQDLTAAILRGFRSVPAPVVSVKEINTINGRLDRSVKVAEF